MGYKLLSALLILIVGWWLMTLLLGSSWDAAIFKTCFVIPCAIASMSAKESLVERVLLLIKSQQPTRTTLAVAPDTPLVAFGQQCARPAFLAQVSHFYGRQSVISAFYRSRNDEIKRAGIPPLSATPLNESRMFESLCESARYEMFRRGELIEDRLNNKVWPSVEDQGLLIQSVQLDDGRTAHIYAVDVLAPLDQDGWMQAYQHGIGRNAGAWDRRPLANVKRYWEAGRGALEFDDPQCGVMPLFRVKLDEVITAAQAAADPLAKADGSVSFNFPEEWR